MAGQCDMLKILSQKEILLKTKGPITIITPLCNTEKSIVLPDGFDALGLALICKQLKSAEIIV